MALAHNISSLLCSVMAWIFFVIGCIGNSTDEDNIKNSSWIMVSGDNADIWVGLQGLVYKSGGSEVLTKFRNCNQSFCDPCKDNGRVAFALVVIAVCFAMFSIVLSAVLCGSEVREVQYAVLSTTGASTIMAVVGWSVFMRRCYHAIDDVLPEDLEYGAGGALVLLGFLLMGLNVVINLHSILKGPAAGPTAGPAPATHQRVPQAEEAKPVE